MRTKLGNILWAIAFIVIGIGLAGDVLELWNFNLLFDSWLALFIIVPCLVDMVKRNINIGNILGTFLGVSLLLNSLDIVPIRVFIKLAIPFIFVLIGVNILINTMQGQKKRVVIQNRGPVRAISAIFNNQNVRPFNEDFYGANINTIFGGVQLDLRNARINQDIVIESTTIFGGIEIYIPPNVKLKISSVPIFGGVCNRSTDCSANAAPTIYLNSTCIVGGVTIR